MPTRSAPNRFATALIDRLSSAAVPSGAAITVEKSVGVGALYPVVPEGTREDVIDLVEPRKVRADLEAGGPIHFGYAAVRSVASCLGNGGLSSGGLWRFTIRLHGPESLAPVQAPVTT